MFIEIIATNYHDCQIIAQAEEILAGLNCVLI